MQSPLEQLLQEIEGRCNAAQFAEARSLGAAAELARQEALRAPLLPDVLAILLQPTVQGCIPDSEHVASCKQRGTAAFGRGQHRQAARLFSEALRYCDEGTAEGAHLAARLYCNRALCLSKLQPPALEAALKDSSAAIELDPSYAKAHYRRAAMRRALAAAGAGGGAAGGGAALEDARRAVQLLQEAGTGGGDAAEAAALVAELEAAAEQEAAAAAAAGQEGAAGEAGGGAGAAAQLNGAASAAEQAQAAAAAAAAAPGLAALVRLAAPRLAVEETAGAGRCLVAAEQLPAAADVLREAPFAHALTKAGRRSACAVCLSPLAPLAAPYYCRRCPLPAYCSAACRDADPFHRPSGPECGLPWTVLLPAEAVAALRLARRLAADGGSASGRQVASLGDHFAELEPAEAVQLAALAAVAHATWQQAAAEAQAAAAGGPPAGGAAGSGEGISGGDVLGALCRLQINGLAVVPPERRGGQDRLALALYPVAALMNHSCRPNVATRFEGCQLAVRTLEPVAPGEALLHCYGPQAGEMTAAQRQGMLRQQYHFHCRCRACSAAAGGGRLADTAPAGLRCPAAPTGGGGGAARCGGAVLPACGVPAGLLHRYPLPAGSGACCSCGAALSQERWQELVLPELQAAAQAHAEAAALLEAQERPPAGAVGGGGAAPAPAAAALQAVRALRQCLRQRQQHLHPHNLLLGATHDALAHAWQLAGNSEAAAQHLRHSLAVLQHSYPAGSTAAAFQQRQLAQALRLAAAAAAAGGGGGVAAAEQLLAEARQAEEECDAVLQLHFGPDHA